MAARGTSVAADHLDSFALLYRSGSMNIKAIEAAEEVQGDDLRSAILARLTEEGIGEVRIGFDGCGDEGQIESITGTKVDGTPGSLDWPCNVPGRTERVINGGGISRAGVTDPLEISRPMSMSELLDDWAYELLDAVGLDWVNNEGGFGEIIILPAENVVRCEMNSRLVFYNY